MSDVDTSRLKALGSNTVYSRYDNPDISILEKFASPIDRNDFDATITIEVPEFTSLCPLTGQPDFAKIVITYTPHEWCVESKSLKLYMMAFRNHGEFHEACVNRICNDLVDLLDPKKLSVRGEFTPRGGIPFWPEIHYTRYSPSPIV